MIEALDLSLSLPRDRYIVEVSRRQIQLRELGWQVYRQKRPVIVIFEGWDVTAATCFRRLETTCRSSPPSRRYSAD